MVADAISQSSHAASGGEEEKETCRMAEEAEGIQTTTTRRTRKLEGGRMNRIPKEWQDRNDERRAPRGHVYLARGPFVWGLGITRAEALRKARSLATPKDRKRCYAQCLPDDVTVSDIDGWASWDEQHPDDCPHCERVK